MTTTLHIVSNVDDQLDIIENSKLNRTKSSLKDGSHKITKRFFDEDGEPNYYDDLVNIKHTFKVMITAEFILNDNDSDKLNAYQMSVGGFDQVNRLAYAYSVTVIKVTSSHKLFKSDVIYSDSGIKSTQFGMYSYHVNEPKQEYIGDRISYEVYDSLDFTKILSEYLDKSFIRNSLIDDILN